MFSRPISEDKEKMEHNDNELVKRIKNGDQGAFRALYDKYADLLFAFILHQVDKETATEIWQETWIVFVEKIYDFQYRSTIFTWLSAIAKNKIADYYRNVRKQERFLNIDRLSFDIDADELDIGSIDGETQADAITVLAHLTSEYRYLLESKYIGNKSIDEIANEMDKSYKSIESMLTRAREAFRKRFKQINIINNAK